MDCTETTSVAAVQAAYVCHAAAIVAITTSGRTAKICAKYRPQCPIIAVTRFPQVARQINLHRGIFPLLFKGTCCVDLSNCEIEEDLYSKAIFCLSFYEIGHLLHLYNPFLFYLKIA